MTTKGPVQKFTIFGYGKEPCTEDCLRRIVIACNKMLRHYGNRDIAFISGNLAVSLCGISNGNGSAKEGIRIEGTLVLKDEEEEAEVSQVERVLDPLIKTLIQKYGLVEFEVYLVTAHKTAITGVGK
jgi:hypothetical protein